MHIYRTFWSFWLMITHDVSQPVILTMLKMLSSFRWILHLCPWKERQLSQHSSHDSRAAFVLSIGPFFYLLGRDYCGYQQVSGSQEIDRYVEAKLWGNPELTMGSVWEIPYWHWYLATRSGAVSVCFQGRWRLSMEKCPHPRQGQFMRVLHNFFLEVLLWFFQFV